MRQLQRVKRKHSRSLFFKIHRSLALPRP
ncbi:MAG TPA: hypothetical protein DCP55_01165, partial [Chitinophagaceae bacterium]|nr:hypothetical protein [Chitinophagaceae bacterium]